MIRALVTGAAGFVGQYLVRQLADSGRVVYSGCRSGESEPTGCHGACVLEVTDLSSVEAAFQAVSPDEVYHLAAIASPVGGNPTGYLRVNVEGTLHMLQAAQKYAEKARILIVTSGLVYGECGGRVAFEGDELRPLGLYASSKAAADLLAGSFANSGLSVFRVRPFNHTGPGQSPGYLASSVARQVAQIALGLCEPRLELGNLQSRRDFTDVRDVVTAYRCIIERGSAGQVYNVCSGAAVSVEELVHITLKVRGIAADIVSVPLRRRAEDIELLAGNTEKVERLGWSRRFTLEQTMSDLVAYWEAELLRENSAGT